MLFERLLRAFTYALSGITGIHQSQSSAVKAKRDLAFILHITQMLC